MKRYIFLLGLLPAFGLKAQPFTLTGTLQGAYGKAHMLLLKLYYTGMDGNNVLDSCRVIGGHFEFHGNIAGPTYAYLSAPAPTPKEEGENVHSVRFFLEPAVMTIVLPAADYSKAVITGSRSEEENEALEKAKAPVYEEMKPLSAAYKKAGRALNEAIKAGRSEAEIDTLRYRSAAIHDSFEPFFARERQIDDSFFAVHPQSYVTAFMLRFHTAYLSLDSLQLFYSRLGERIQQSSSGRLIADEIEKLRAGSPGSAAKDFTVPDIHGNLFTLSALRGKYVLIDFWASWCVPCRKSMPHVKELYAMYKDKGLDVVAVADDDRDSVIWRKAVLKDGTGEWHNVLRGLDYGKLNRHEKNERDISEKFGIHSLPTKVLIDPNGMIIGRYDQGTPEEAEALDKKLAELLR